MATNNQISEDDIKILMDQSNINREIAKRLLKDNSGDIVECIIKIERYLCFIFQLMIKVKSID